mgnify:CR=1 FL=1
MKKKNIVFNTIVTFYVMMTMTFFSLMIFGESMTSFQNIINILITVVLPMLYVPKQLRKMNLLKNEYKIKRNIKPFTFIAMIIWIFLCTKLLPMLGDFIFGVNELGFIKESKSITVFISIVVLGLGLILIYLYQINKDVEKEKKKETLNQ